MDDRKFAIAIALGVHLFAFVLLAVSFHGKPARLPVAVPQMEAVETVAVDEAVVEEELRKLRSEEQARRDVESARQRKLANEAQQMRREREQEAQRLAELKQKRDQEQRERKAAEEAERKRITELKAEQQRLEQKRAEEAKRVAAMEKKRKEAEARELERKKAAAEAALKAQMAAEAEAMAREQASRNDRLKAEYVDLIANKVSRNWLRPAGTAGSVDCRVMVRQIPGGEVVDVRLLQSCGSPALDRSVEAAVRKASPLPEPPTPDVFDREINFRFHTER